MNMDGELLGHPTADVPVWLQAAAGTFTPTPWPDDTTPADDLNMNSLAVLHQAADADSHVVFMAKHTGGGLRTVASLRVGDVAETLPGFFDTLLRDGYVTLNWFSHPFRGKDGKMHWRTKSMLRGIGCCYADLDFYALPSAPTFAGAYAALHVLVARGLLPWPSAVANSGRGMYALWFFRSAVEAGGEARRLYDATQRRIHNVLRFLGADKKALDTSRVLRLDGSYNTKEGAGRVQWVHSRDSNGKVLAYDLAELACAVCAPAPPQQPPPLPKAKGETRRQRVRGVTVRRGEPLRPGSLMPDDLPEPNSAERYVPHERILDLIDLAESRGGIMEGCRHFFLYRYAQSLAQLGVAGDDLYARIQDVNQRVCGGGQTTDEVKAACSVEAWVRDGGFKQTRSDTIADDLGVSAAEARALGLRSIMPTEERQRRLKEQRAAAKNRRDARRSRKDECVILIRAIMTRCKAHGYLPGRDALAAELASSGYEYSPVTIDRWARACGFRPNRRGRPKRHS